MEQREIDFILPHIEEIEMKYRNDPKNAYDVQVEQSLFNELNALGYNFAWSYQFTGNTFTAKDKAVIPIVIKHLEMFKNHNKKHHYIGCLGVKGFYDATEYLIGEYNKYLPTDNEDSILYMVSQTLARIRDKRYMDVYLDYLSEEKVVCSTWFIVEMLGFMRYEKAIPSFIRLLDGEQRIKDSFYGSTIECGKYLVSQAAITALSRFRKAEYKKYIEKFLEPEKIPWIQFTESKEKKSNLRRTYTQYRNVTKKALERMIE
ncbi:hypothetical protein [Pumilibacter muris]|uniref:hypothetical protein n=1 Tax=Pumilibacter muris TaxID=2941510 RepID=UPI00203BEA8B|nr:hypothetical protein [Pumilibacter muris]